MTVLCNVSNSHVTIYRANTVCPIVKVTLVSSQVLLGNALTVQ